MKKVGIVTVIAAVFGLLLGISALSAKSEKTDKTAKMDKADKSSAISLFKSKCGFCHSLTVDGKSVVTATTGPDLTGIAGKRPEAYVKLYMSNPDKARKQFADIYNKEVKGKYSMVMPKVKVSEKDVDKIFTILK